MATVPGLSLGIWLIGGGTQLCSPGRERNDPGFWGDPRIKALLETAPSDCGVFQRLGAAIWIFFHWDVQVEILDVPHPHPALAPRK